MAPMILCNARSWSGLHLCSLPHGHFGWHQSNGVERDRLWSRGPEKIEEGLGRKFPRLAPAFGSGS